MSAAALPNAMVVGASLLAIWAYVRLGTRRPKSFRRIVGHVAAATVALIVFHAVFDAESAGRAAGTTAALFAFFLPAVTYGFLSALYFLEHVHRALNPR